MLRRIIRRPVGLIVLLVVLGILVLLAANLVILFSSGTKIEPGREASAPHAQVALVLGAQVKPDGELSPMLRDRVRTGYDLYRRARVDKVLVSGDHARDDYDEVNAMLRELRRLGVPDEDVFTDHAGLDTWDSVQRAHEVFRVKSALVVSQSYHLARAVWLAKRAGLRATGVAAGTSTYGGEAASGARREWLARPKAAADALLGTEPEFGGKAIPITGDGRASRG